MLCRFKEIKSFEHEAIADTERKEDDDWCRFSAQEEKHGERRHNRALTSHVFVFDDSMSAFFLGKDALFLLLFCSCHAKSLAMCCFSVTKSGGQPKISCIMRKPQPLGTEFKSVVLWLETQEGKEQIIKRVY